MEDQIEGEGGITLLKNKWLDCPWCGAVTRTFWEGNDELCLACGKVVNGKRNDIRPSRDGEDTNEL